MIRLRKDTTDLILSDKTEISLERNHPALSSDISLGDYSYPFDVPWDEGGINAKALKHPNEPDNHLLPADEDTR